MLASVCRYEVGKVHVWDEIRWQGEKHLNQPVLVVREATYDEWVQCMKDTDQWQERWTERAMNTLGYRNYYEISID